MGYVARYRKDAQEKGLQGWQRFYIAEIEKTSEAIIAYLNPHGYWKGGEWVVTWNPFPQFPMTLSNYDEAFEYLSSLLTTCGADRFPVRDKEQPVQSVGITRRQDGGGSH